MLPVVGTEKNEWITIRMTPWQPTYLSHLRLFCVALLFSCLVLRDQSLRDGILIFFFYRRSVSVMHCTALLSTVAYSTTSYHRIGHEKHRHAEREEAKRIEKSSKQQEVLLYGQRPRAFRGQ